MKTNKLLLELTNENNYKTYIQNLDIDITFKSKLLNLLELECDKERFSLWKEMLSDLNDNNELNAIANPFFIGFGNPNSDILFLGQEKAFDPINNPNLLLHESINNNFLWKKIMNNKEDLLFNPNFPRGYHNDDKMKLSHTWSFYSKVISPIFNIESEKLFRETLNVENSLFNRCFISEINVTPSKKNKKAKVTELRKNFLKNNFYKSFKYVIIGGKSALSNNPSKDIKEIFDADIFIEDCLIGYYGQNKKKTATIYKSKNQTIIACHQLSGSAGWKNDHLDVLHTLLSLKK